MDELIRRRDALRFPELYDLLERNIAPQYDRREALTRLLRLVQDTEKPLVKTLSQHMRLREASVLDLGCGLGHETCNFADAAATAVGLDRDPSRMEVAVAVARERGVSPGWVIGDATRAPFRPGSFDVVLCKHLIEHVACPERFLRFLVGLLKPGAALYVDYPSRWHFSQLLSDDHYGLPLVVALPRPLASFIVTRVFRYEREYSTNVFLTHRRIMKAMRGLNVSVRQVLPDPDVLVQRLGDPSTIARKFPRIVLKLLHSLGYKRALVNLARRMRAPDIISSNVGLLFVKGRKQ